MDDDVSHRHRRMPAAAIPPMRKAAAAAPAAAAAAADAEMGEDDELQEISTSSWGEVPKRR
jgi:hypothetical protein